VKNPFQEVDRDGFLATILELHNSGQIKLQGRTILTSVKNNTMPTQQQWAIQAIKSLGSDGKDEVEIPDQEHKGEGIEAFNRHYGFWQKHAMKIVRSGRFYEHLGSTVMSVFSIFFLINLVADTEIPLRELAGLPDLPRRDARAFDRSVRRLVSRMVSADDTKEYIRTVDSLGPVVLYGVEERGERDSGQAGVLG
jgi:hypothetical protein